MTFQENKRELEYRIGEQIERIIIQSQGTNNKVKAIRRVAEKVAPRWDVAPSTAISLITSICGGLPYGKTSITAKTQNNLYRLAVLLEESEVPEDHEIVSFIKEFDPRFDYRPRKAELKTQQPVVAESKSIEDKLRQLKPDDVHRVGQLVDTILETYQT